MSSFDTTHIEYVEIIGKKKSTYVERKTIMDYAELITAINTFDYKNAKSIRGSIIECFCTGKEQSIEGYKIKIGTTVPELTEDNNENKQS